MSVTRLRPGNSTTWPPGMLQIDWQIRGATGDAVHVEMETLSAGRPATAVQTAGHQSAILGGLAEPVALVARPRSDRAPFADGVTVQAQISRPAADTDADQVVLTPVDVSGTSSAVLFTVAPAPGGWEITAAPAGQTTTASALGGQPTTTSGVPDRPVRSTQAGVEATRPASDPPTATLGTIRRAVYAARRQVGASTLPADQLSTMVVAVDRSASMLPHHRSGALRAILELIVGVNSVCGTDRSIPMWTMGYHPGRIHPDLSEASIAGYVETVLADQALTNGTVFTPLVERLPRNADRQIVFVISDGAPPDLEAAAAAVRARTDPPGALSWHFVVLARHHDDPAVRAEPWRDELRPLVPLVNQGLLTVSAISPDSSPEWLANRLTSSDELDAVVATLGVRRAGTTTEDS